MDHLAGPLLIKQHLNLSKLKTPQRSLPFFLETDSSGFAISGILMQKHNNKFHPVEFYSCSLFPMEHNYPTLDQELLAIIKSLTHWRHFLEGAEHTIIICSDNSALFATSHDIKPNGLPTFLDLISALNIFWGRVTRPMDYPDNRIIFQIRLTMQIKFFSLLHCLSML